MDNRLEYCQKALIILGMTKDGTMLRAEDYSLVEKAILSTTFDQHDLETLESLHQKVVSKAYEPNWLYGIENLTADELGSVFYKTKKVAHFDPPVSVDKYEQLKELKYRCDHLDLIGADLNEVTAIKRWGMFNDLKPMDYYVTLISRHYRIVLKDQRVLIFLRVFPYGFESKEVVCARWNGRNWMFVFKNSPEELDDYFNLQALGSLRKRHDEINTGLMSGSQLSQYFMGIGVPHNLVELMMSCYVQTKRAPWNVKRVMN